MVIFIRTLIMYSVVIFVMRMMGKRQIGQLQPYELVIALMVSELAAMPMQDIAIPLLDGILPILTLLAAQLLISLLLLKSNKARKLFCGLPILLINKGVIVEDNLRNEMYNLNDLLEALRLKGFPNMADVSSAILENNGELSVIPKNAARAISVADMNLPISEEMPIMDLIIDGRLLNVNLKQRGIQLSDLENEIGKMGANDIKDILYCSVDYLNVYFIQLKRSK